MGIYLLMNANRMNCKVCSYDFLDLTRPQNKDRAGTLGSTVEKQPNCCILKRGHTDVMKMNIKSRLIEATNVACSPNCFKPGGKNNNFSKTQNHNDLTGNLHQEQSIYWKNVDQM